MKLTCSRDLLLNSINVVSKAVSSRTTLPILECILLTADERGLVLTANDLEIGIEASPIEADIEREGKVALEARIFSEIIKRVNGVDVTLDTDKDFITVISSGNSEFKVMGRDGADFPAMPKIERKDKQTILQKDLRDMIRETIFSVAQDDSKPVLTGELIEINNGIIDMVSVDGYRISYKKSNLLSSSGEEEAIIPAKTLNEISKILSSEEDEEADIYFTDKHALFDISGNIVVSRLIDGDYIKYEQSFTDEYKTRIDCDRNELISSLERASLLSRETRKTPVILEIKSDKISISSNTDIGTSHEELECAFTGDDLRIAFNPRYLIEALKAISDDIVSLRFTTHLSPCIIKGVEESNYKYLILPLRMW